MLVRTLKPLFDTTSYEHSNPRARLPCSEIPQQFCDVGAPRIPTKSKSFLRIFGPRIAKSLKIFHTGKGPLAGTEDTFPGPDNPSKMRRSVENAEHVGGYQEMIHIGPTLRKSRS